MNATTERTILERAHRLIKAATGEEYGDGEVVTDICVGYAEPGYGNDETVVVFGNWNDGRPTPSAPITSRVPSRLFNALERIGAECQWLDEWTRCTECYRAMRTESDSYRWTMYGSFSEDGYVCADCMKKYPLDYLTEGLDYSETGTYVNNANNAVTWLTSAELSAIGFTQWQADDPQTYENGWHPGQTDDPHAILALIRKSTEANVVFLIESVGQFDMRFSAWTQDPTDDEEDNY